MNSHMRDTTIVDQGKERSESLAFIGEEPLSIRVQGNPYAVVMRTPGDDAELGADQSSQNRSGDQHEAATKAARRS